MKNLNSPEFGMNNFTSFNYEVDDIIKKLYKLNFLTQFNQFISVMRLNISILNISENTIEKLHSIKCIDSENNITTIGDVIKLGSPELKKLPGFGYQKVQKIKDALLDLSQASNEIISLFEKGLNYPTPKIHF